MKLKSQVHQGAFQYPLDIIVSRNVYKPLDLHDEFPERYEFTAAVVALQPKHPSTLNTMSLFEL